MSKVIPFKALLPTVQVAPQMISPPYDVVGVEEARELVKDNPFSFLHITRSEIDLDPEISPYDDTVYQRATASLRLFEEKNYLVPAEPAFYVYRQIMSGLSQTGLVCGVSVDEYESGKIKKHERTREEKVTDRTRHAYVTQAHTEPVMMIHRASEAIAYLLNESEADADPLFDIVDRDGVRHMLWRARNPVPIQSAFSGLEAIYIADGHHRSESARRVRDLMRKDNPDHNGSESYNFFPAVVYPHNEVRVFEYDWKGESFRRPLSKYSTEDIMKLADEEGIMPPKSTWFAPKLGSGLFVYTF